MKKLSSFFVFKKISYQLLAVTILLVLAYGGNTRAQRLPIPADQTPKITLQDCVLTAEQIKAIEEAFTKGRIQALLFMRDVCRNYKPNIFNPNQPLPSIKEIIICPQDNPYYAGKFDPLTNTIYLYVQKDDPECKNLVDTLLHEIGHTIGLKFLEIWPKFWGEGIAEQNMYNCTKNGKEKGLEALKHAYKQICETEENLDPEELKKENQRLDSFFVAIIAGTSFNPLGQYDTYYAISLFFQSQVRPVESILADLKKCEEKGYPPKGIILGTQQQMFDIMGAYTKRAIACAKGVLDNYKNSSDGKKNPITRERFCKWLETDIKNKERKLNSSK